MTNSNFAVPVENRYFEDYVAGSVHELGSIAVEEAEMIAFSKCYDTQVFHTDSEAAKNTIYGSLIASGWLTASLMMRLCTDHYLSHVASLGSPGVDELRWIKPVHSGDVLSFRVTVLETNHSRSKPDRGIVRSFFEGINQNAEVVLSMKAVNLFLCREKA